MRQLKMTNYFTNRESVSLSIYLSEVGKESKLIGIEEEVELAQRIKMGDKEALNKLVIANLRFVITVAKQYQNQGLSLPDLINEGNLGLIEAAKRFDETRGFKFISFAIWWIRHSLQEAVVEQSRVIRLPLNKVGALNKIGRAYSKFEHEHERAPSNDELADRLNFSVKKIDEALRCSRKASSLDEPIFIKEGTDFTLLEMTSNELPNSDYRLIKESLSLDIERSLNTIDEKESEIVRMFFGIGYQYPKTLEEISEELYMTPENVRLLKNKAIRKLQSPGRSKKLKSYLG